MALSTSITVGQAGHAGLHNAERVEINALLAKFGVDGKILAGLLPDTGVIDEGELAAALAPFLDSTEAAAQIAAAIAALPPSTISGVTGLQAALDAKIDAADAVEAPATSGLLIWDASTGTTSTVVPGTYAPAASVPVVFQGTGGTADQAAALQAAVDGMKVSGKLRGALVIRGDVRLGAKLLLDGGYTATRSNWAAAQHAPFSLVVEGSLKPDATVPVAIEARGLYGPTLDVRLTGGGAQRTVANAAITAGQAILTSATAAFTSADVGRLVRVEGAGLNGEAPLLARVASVTNGTTAVLDDTAVVTVTGARCAIRTIGLHVADLIHAEVSITAREYAGNVLWHDGKADGNDAVTQSTIRKLHALECGQAAAIKRLFYGFGAFMDVWDSGCADGTVFYDGADLQLVHWENYSPSSQTVGLLFANMNNMAGSSIALGDNPSQALMRVIGGDGNGIARLFLTSNAATKVGLDLVEVKSINIEDVQTDRCSVGVQVRGGAQNGIRVGQHRSLTGDTVGTRIAAGPVTSYMQLVDIGGYWNFTGTNAVVVASSVTGGRVKVHGQVDATVNQSGGSGIKTVDCQAANVILDVAGLTQLSNNGTVAAGVAHVTTANLIGLTEARLGNGPAPTSLPVTVVASAYNASVANTGTETSIVTYAIPGNLLTAGSRFRIKARGTFDNQATSGNIELRVKHGTQVMYYRNVGYASAQTGAVWEAEFDVVYTTAGGSAAIVTVGGMRSSISGETSLAPARGTTTGNTTVNQDLAFTVDWATASATNVWRVDTATIERLA